jgi:hypothetical protein
MFRTADVCVLRMAIEASGIAAPELSVTVPEMDAVAACPCARCTGNASTKAHMAQIERVLLESICIAPVTIFLFFLNLRETGWYRPLGTLGQEA